MVGQARPGKTLKVGGELTATADGNRLIIEATGGLSVATLFDTQGIVLWMWHPLSGWYVERDTREGDADGEGPIDGDDSRTDGDSAA